MCQRTEEISSNVSWWTLTESMSGMEISPFWEPIHDAAFMATNCHSTCCSILQPYNQIRARRVAHTDPSTCVQTIIHCICNWTLHKIAPMSRSESNDSRYALQCPDLNQMIRDTRSNVPIWIKWFAIRAPMSRSESNDSRYSLQSPDLNQMIRDTRSDVPIWIKWFAILAPKSRS